LRGRRIIQDYDRSVANQRPGQGNPLPQLHRDLGPLGPHLEIDP
jgi:hypothetical protein